MCLLAIRSAVSDPLFATETDVIHTHSNVGTSYIQPNTYAQSRSLALHHSTLEFSGPPSLNVYFRCSGDTNSVVICCCLHRESKIRACIRASMSRSECHRVSTKISITQRCNQQPSGCDSATSRSLSLVYIFNMLNIKKGNTPTAKHEAVLCLSLASSAGWGFGPMFEAIIWTNCRQFRMMPLQSGSNINGRLCSSVLLWERLNQMGEEKGSDTERKGEAEEAIFMLNRWTQRKKIIVDREAEKYQSSKREWQK